MIDIKKSKIESLFTCTQTKQHKTETNAATHNTYQNGPGSFSECGPWQVPTNPCLWFRRLIDHLSPYYKSSATHISYQTLCFEFMILSNWKQWWQWKMILSRSQEQFHSNGKSNQDSQYLIIITTRIRRHWSWERRRHLVPPCYLRRIPGQVLGSGQIDGGLSVPFLPNPNAWVRRVVSSRLFWSGYEAKRRFRRKLSNPIIHRSKRRLVDGLCRLLSLRRHSGFQRPQLVGDVELGSVFSEILRE